MAYTSTEIDPGDTPSVGVLGDDTGSGIAQGIKLIKSTAGSVVPTGIDADPLVVRSRRLGTQDYDSGRVAATTALTSVTTATIYPESGFVANLTSADHWLKITNSADASHAEQFPLAPYEVRPWPITIAMVGLKIQADANSAIVVGVRGAQA